MKLSKDVCKFMAAVLMCSLLICGAFANTAQAAEAADLRSKLLEMCSVDISSQIDYPYYFHGTYSPQGTDIYSIFDFQGATIVGVRTEDKSTIEYYSYSEKKGNLEKTSVHWYCYNEATKAVYDQSNNGLTIAGDWALVSTNLPYFVDKESALAYLRNGDTSGLLNASDVGSQYSEDVPVVENAYLTYTYTVQDGKESQDLFDCWVHFDFPESAEGYNAKVYLMTTFRINVIPRIGSATPKRYTTYDTPMYDGWDVSYQTDSVTLDYADLDVSLKAIDLCYASSEYAQAKKDKGLLEALVLQDYATTFLIQLDNGRYKGDYVRLSINKDGLVETEITSGSGKNSLGATQETAGGTTEIVGGDTDKTDAIKGNGKVKDSYDIDSSIKQGDNELSTEGIITGIKNMFSADGMGGVIQLLGDTFSFIPTPIITLMIGGFATCMAVVVIKFIRG